MGLRLNKTRKSRVFRFAKGLDMRRENLSILTLMESLSGVSERKISREGEY